MAKLTWKTIQIPLGNLKEWDKNPATISKEDAKQLARSLDKFGYIIPFVAAAPKNGKAELPLLDGHQRKAVELSLRKTDPKTLVDVRVPNRPLTEKEKQEAVIRMRSNTGAYDGESLLNWFEGADLLDWGMPQKQLEGFGFEFGDDSKDAEPQIDRAGELLKKWKVQTGDLWQIGEHRLICGDCTDAAVVARVMEGEKADMTFTSPPYNANVKMGNYYVIDGKRTRVNEPLYEENERDNMSPEVYIKFCISALTACFENTSRFVFWNVGYNANARHEYIDAIYPFREKLRETIIWKKNAMPVANGFTRNHEFIFLFSVDGTNINNEYDTLHTVWDVNNSGSQEENHKACFPVELPQKAIGLSNAMQTIFEPFSGSGTTLVACQNLNRRGRAVEISPAYCAVTLERMATAFPDLEIKRLK